LLAKIVARVIDRFQFIDLALNLVEFFKFPLALGSGIDVSFRAIAVARIPSRFDHGQKEISAVDRTRGIVEFLAAGTASIRARWCCDWGFPASVNECRHAISQSMILTAPRPHKSSTREIKLRSGCTL
jgi:hypothetical protein